MAPKKPKLFTKSWVTARSDFMLAMSGIFKAFPGVQALDDAHLTVREGEIHGLVGENGAGKSTLIKVLAGVYERDAGNVAIAGKNLDQLTPQLIHSCGVRFIHQELHLVPHFTVAESVFMGQELSGPFGVKRRAMRRAAESFLQESLNTQMNGNTLIRDLSVAQRKIVQIARALVDDEAQLVVFDEPTAPLAAGETDQLFTAIRRLRERKIAIVYVSHYLGEITQLCDRVTIFRNGKTVSTLDAVNDNSTDIIIEQMIGRELEALYPERMHEVGAPFLSVNHLGSEQRYNDVSFEVGRGEIVGIAGLIGSGREELVDSLYGLLSPDAGSITIDGESVHLDSPAKAVAKGMVLVPRDRRHDGLVLDFSVADNINLASLDEVAVAKLEKRGAAEQRASALADSLDIRPRNAQAITRFLSGGNQQKVVLARWLATGSKLFVLDEPTVGVDVGAKVEIYQLIENLARKGSSVIVSSSDPAELLGLCDRIAVMYRGELVSMLAVESLTQDLLLSLSTAGVQKGEPTAA